MKLCFIHSRQSVGIILTRILAALLLLSLIGCSDGTSSEQPVVKSMGEDQAGEENEQIRENLETVLAKLEEVELKIAELEAAKAEPRTEDAQDTAQEMKEEPAVSPIDLVAPQREPAKLLVGEWFYPEFFEQTLIDNWTQSLVFNANGTGRIIRTFYLPKDIGDYSSSDSLEEVSLTFSWSLDGDVLHTAYDDGAGGFVDYTFWPEQQQLIVKNENGHVLNDETHVYKRERSPVPGEYVEADVIFRNIQALNVSRMRKFLGTWYWDVMVWTFNEDGTGILDIPKIGNQPAEIREFSYQVLDMSSDLTSASLAIDWDGSATAYYYPTFNADGSMSLANLNNVQVKLTRTFDINNCSISKEIVSNVMEVWTGSIFSDFLPFS